MSDPDPSFPPLLSGHLVHGKGDLLQKAKVGISQGLYGAGDVLWKKSYEVVDLAIVLEPDIPLEKAVQMIPLTMVACGDSLGALTPPQVGVSFKWPNMIKVNYGNVGLVRAMADMRAKSTGGAPDWLIIGLTIRLRHNSKKFEPGSNPDITALAEEGCPDLTCSKFIESFSRHFLTWINYWQDDGFKPVHAAWLFRATDQKQETVFEFGEVKFEGEFLGLDENGNLLAKTNDGKVCNHFLSEILEPHESTDSF